MKFDLQKLRDHYDAGNTLDYASRLKSLRALLRMVMENEEAIYSALYSDLKKSKEESWSTETGQVVEEIKYALRHLRSWMKPKKVATGLVSFPSSGAIYHDPLGVVLIIAPWNYPLQLLLVPLAGALAAGNCVVLKPSESAPATEALVAEMIQKTFSPGLVKVVSGDGAEVVPAMMREFRFDHIFYTGSNRTGKEIYKMAAEQLIPVTLELGGKSPCIVEKDADITVTAKRIVFGKFLNAGQTCIAPDYVLVHHSVKDRLLSEMREAIGQFYTSDAAASDEYGKIINRSRFDALNRYLAGSTIYCGGKTDAGRLYIEPTILTPVSMESEIMNEEIFGPILPVISFETTDEAIAIVNRNSHPLSLYLFTKDKNVGHKWLTTVAFGNGCINDCLLQFANKHMPFGGIGSSGIGAYHGKYSFDLFTHKKPVLRASLKMDPSFKYPPFKGKLKWVKKLIG